MSNDADHEEGAPHALPETASQAEHAGFDEALYLTLNPDVAQVVQEGRTTGLKHWLEYGHKEEATGNRPSILYPFYYRAMSNQALSPPTAEEISDFEATLYLTENPDVRAAIGDNPVAALNHWIDHGRAEGRIATSRKAYSSRTNDPSKIAAKPFGVNFYAPFTARSGLGTAARGYLAALRAAGAPVHLVNIDFSVGQPRVAAREYDLPGPYRINLIQVNADSLDRFYGLFRRGRFDDAYNIGIWAWEMNVLRPDWFASFGAVDEVWTLSDFNTDAVAVMAPVPVRTMNCVVRPPARAEFDRAHFSLPDGFVFLAVFDVGSSIDRKNPHAVVRAFQQAFAGRPDVHLVLKFHASHTDPAALRRFLQSVQGVPNVIIRSGSLTDPEMQSLQACCDCLVSPHRSEGFGLNIAEFMGMEKPVITTGYSGNMDFTDAENAYLIPFRLTQIVDGSGPYLPGYMWAEPDGEVLAALMRAVVDDPAEARARGMRAARTVAEKLSAKAIGARITDRFMALGLQQEAPLYATLVARPRSKVLPPPGAIVALTTQPAITAHPTFSLIVPVYNVDAVYLEACIASVRAQTYERWELCLCDDRSTRAETIAVLDRVLGSDPRIRVRRLPKNLGIAGASNAAVQMATGSYLVMLDNDDELTPNALQEMANAVIANPSIDAIYSDEDKYDLTGRICDHYYKPDWSPEHLESVMYTLHPLTVRTKLFLELGGFREAFSGAQDWDLMLRVSRATTAIHHIRKVLYHWRMIPGSASAEVDAKPEALTAGKRALQDHVAAKYGDAAQVEDAPLMGYYRVRHRVSGNPPVTLLITTNNSKLQIGDRKPFVMVENMIESIQNHTDYDNYRIVVVDNGNTSAKTKASYRKSKIELHSYPGSQEHFNYAEKANFAYRKVRTDNVVVMNDDMEAFDDDWLRALLEFSTRPEIGAAAGKWLHGDGTIQHVGVVLGVNAGAAHVYHGFPGDYVGYNGFTHVIRNYSALTGACLATRMSVLNELGGLDTRLATEFNDIDICLKMGQHGYRIVYTPYSKLIHFESKTAIRTSHNDEEVALFKERWGYKVADDPFYNPNLSRDRHDFALR